MPVQCNLCHRHVPAELAKVYATMEALRAAPQIQPFLKWIRKQKPGRVFRTRTSADHPDIKKRRRRGRY
jgi:hypothetical protein